MPLYEFECEACKARFERIQKFADANPEVCPTCGNGPIRRLLSSPAIQFKGSGFYITDYAKKSSPDSSGSKSSGEKSEKSGSDSKSGDSGSTSTASSTPASTSSSTTTTSSSDSGSSSSDKKS